MTTRLAFCITDLDVGGAEQALVELAIRLNRSDWEPHVFCLAGPGPLVDKLSSAQVPLTCLGARGVRSVWVIAKLARQLQDFQPALVQTFLFHANIAGRIAGKLAGVKRIVSGIRVAEQSSRIPLWMDRWTNFLVDCNVCVSQSVADFSIRNARLKAHKTRVIRNAVDAARFCQASAADLTEFGIPPNHRTIIAVGRLDRQKGPRYLLEAAKNLLPAHKDLHFLFVGDGPLREDLTSWVAAEKLQHQVHFSGWRPDVPDLMKAATCLVLPSLWEGMPNVLLEAMAARLPVVATRVEGVEELVQSDHTAILVAPKSSTELAAALQRLLQHPLLAQEMADRAQDVAIKQFTYDSAVSEYDRLYRSLLSPPRSS